MLALNNYNKCIFIFKNLFSPPFIIIFANYSHVSPIAVYPYIVRPTWLDLCILSSLLSK